jgi:CheY-like chemotaxis protein
MTPLPTILVADDTATNLEFVDSILGSDYEILVATHGQEAIELAQAELPDLILMDVVMPGMDGYEACRYLKADDCTSHIPVLFLTALADMDALVKGFEAGGVDFVTKPFRPEELQARVRTHIALKQARDREAALRKELEASLAEIKQLSGLLPICATCKKIRDEQGGWNPLEVYISEHSEADFTHGICPDCSKTMLAEARMARKS